MFQGSDDKLEWVAKLLAAPLPAKPGIAAKQDIKEEGKATNKVLQAVATAFRSDVQGLVQDRMGLNEAIAEAAEANISVQVAE